MESQLQRSMDIKKRNRLELKVIGRILRESTTIMNLQEHKNYIRIPMGWGLLVFFFSCAVPENQNLLTELRIQSDVEALASPYMEGRETGSIGEIRAAAWLDSNFQAIGLIPNGMEGSFQTFTYKPHPPMQMHGSGDSMSLGMALVKEIEGRNVLYVSASTKSSQVGVLAAHYDHLGYGDENSLFRGEPTLHFGADDNASGVSGMLELSRRFASQPVSRPILWAAFSGEEKGLWGSNHFCKNPTVGLDSIAYMINLDMIGRLHGDTLAVYGTGTSPHWMSLLEKCNVDSLTLIPSESGVGPSDHTSFYLEGIPVLHFFTGQHPDYHKPSDTPDKINAEGIRKVVDFVERVMRELDNKDEWEFTATQDQDKQNTPSFKVTLGVIPDYLFDGMGMRIDGVSEGRPAALAGLQRGDVVVKIDTVKVTDMMTYMIALSLFESGQVSRVEVLRDDLLSDFMVTWD
ncbi:MAG: M28 family peptidase [Flavobacteriales bacterium]